MSIILNDKIYGHDEVIEGFNKSMSDNKLHHAWILSGPKSIGKTSVAYNFAKTLLTTSNNQAAKLIENNCHPDLFVLQSENVTDKLSTDDHEIKIEQVRKLLDFLHKTAALSARKVVIVDSIEMLNNNANNALLKALEEPGQTVFLLVTHRLWVIPATIKSRCMILKFKPLSFNDFKKIIGDHKNCNVESIYQLGNGSISTALKLINEEKFLQLIIKIKSLVNNYPHTDLKELLSLKKDLVKDDNWYYFKLLILSFQINRIKDNSKSGINVDALIQWYEQTIKILDDQNIYNLDKENVTLNIFSER